MSKIETLLFIFQLLPFISPESPNYAKTLALFPDQNPSPKFSRRVSKPIIGEDGNVYACSENYFYAFESNGSLSWTLHLNYTCNPATAPVHGGRGKIFLVAENRVLKINFLGSGNFGPKADIFFGSDMEEQKIIGVSISTISSSVFINVKNRGLFAYTMLGKLIWSAGPVLNQWGYRQGCKKNITGCFFTSIPMMDQCEGSIYISNSEGELYSLSSHNARFKWVQDLSSFDKSFTITPGNNGRLYVTVPTRSLILALNVFTGNLMWQGTIGPLSSPDFTPVVDSNGWISIGSLDGFLYSFSPSGELRKLSKDSTENLLIQVGPLLDCSGYAIYVSQTKMEEKTSHVIDDYSYVSAKRPKGVTFTLLVPSTGSIYWSESYPGQLISVLSRSDLSHFLLDEAIVLAFLAASKMGNPFPCRSRHQKLVSSCSQGRPKKLSIYTGTERSSLLFLFFQTAILIVLGLVVRFCCIFWKKKKVQGQSLGIFLEKRRALRLKKKAYDRSITELKQKALEEPETNEVLEELGTLIREKEGIERKLSTTYSLGQDRTGSMSKSKSLLPLLDRKARSYLFQGTRKESVTIFHTLSEDTSSSSGESSIFPHSENEWSSFNEGEEEEEEEMKGMGKGKEKAPIEDIDSSSDDEVFESGYWKGYSEVGPSSIGFGKSVLQDGGEEEEVEFRQSGDEGG